MDSEGNATLPTLPPGDEDAPFLPLSPWLLQEKGCRHCLSSQLMCHRGAQPTAALSFYYIHCGAITTRTTFNSKGPIMAISSLSHFKAACNFLTRLTHASICPRNVKSSRSLYLH